MRDGSFLSGGRASGNQEKIRSPNTIPCPIMRSPGYDHVKGETLFIALQARLRNIGAKSPLVFWKLASISGGGR